MFTEVTKKCRIDFKPAAYNIDMPRQQELFSKAYTNNSHIQMGLFFEMLTAALFGGRLEDSIARSRRGKMKEPSGPMPDVWDQVRDRMGESKACRNGHQLNLLDGQITLYRKFQVLQPNTRIYFSIWRHRLSHIKNYRGGSVSLFKELSEKTRAGIILPFTIINYIHGMGEDMREHIQAKHGIKLRRYETDAWDHCTRISSTLINSFLLKPQKTLSRLGLDIDEYSWQRYLVPKITVAEATITNNVPFILIIDNDHKANVEKYVNDIVPF